jgi:hypothetical protein
MHLLVTKNNDIDRNIFVLVCRLVKRFLATHNIQQKKENMSILSVFFFHVENNLYTVHHIYEKSRSGNKAGATHVQIYKTTHIQLDAILTQSDAKLLLYVLKSFAG